MSDPGRVAVVGCGVIGAAWAARFRLCGHDVAVFDPAPDAATVLEDAMRRANAAWTTLGLPVHRRGDQIVCATIEDAVAEAVHVQESVPERLELKHQTLRTIDAATSPSTTIASSTSGIRPTALADGLQHAERFVVGHPFNPVYLLPAVEVVGGDATSPTTIEMVMAFYEGVGMHPTHVAVEIDAFVADRLLEAVWREALWLVHDGVATTQEIDDIIRHGFGLRWAQMGLFETYRTAGGADGMRAFLAQFGPALQWPWSKLTDVPDWTDDLVELIAAQSDDQSGDRTIAELLEERDRNLVAILAALESVDAGAGRTLAAFRRRRQPDGAR